MADFAGGRTKGKHPNVTFRDPNPFPSSTSPLLVEQVETQGQCHGDTGTLSHPGRLSQNRRPSFTALSLSDWQSGITMRHDKKGSGRG
jgi:hypothetical protein